MGNIVILASFEHHFIRLHKNLVQHPSINISTKRRDKRDGLIWGIFFLTNFDVIYKQGLKSKQKQGVLFTYEDLHLFTCNSYIYILVNFLSVTKYLGN